jgi:hypothetical protein
MGQDLPPQWGYIPTKTWRWCSTSQKWDIYRPRFFNRLFRPKLFRSFEHRSPHETYHVDPRGPTWLTWPSCWVTLVTPGLRFATSQQQLRPVSDGSVGPFSSHFEVILSITSTLRGYVGILWCPLWLGWCLNGTFRYSWSETDQTHTDTRAYVYIYI